MFLALFRNSCRVCPGLKEACKKVPDLFSRTYREKVRCRGKNMAFHLSEKVLFCILPLVGRRGEGITFLLVVCSPKHGQNCFTYIKRYNGEN